MALEIPKALQNDLLFFLNICYTLPLWKYWLYLKLLLGSLFFRKQYAIVHETVFDFRYTSVKGEQ